MSMGSCTLEGLADVMMQTCHERYQNKMKIENCNKGRYKTIDIGKQWQEKKMDGLELSEYTRNITREIKQLQKGTRNMGENR